MALSVLDPITPAMDHTKLVLFKPFDLGKWLRLGFCAFLMGLAEGGSGGFGGGGSPGGGGPGGPGGRHEFEHAMDWVRENLAIIAIVVAVVVLVLFLVGLILVWLGSRGRFMFLDGIVRNRGAVVEPWHEFRREGNSVFLFRLCLGLAGLLAVALILALSGCVALPDIQSGQFGGFAVGGIATGIVLLVGFALTMGIIGVLLRDFVVPIMYLRRITVLAAWREFHQSMFAGHLTTFVLYLLVKILIALVVGFIAFAALCLTCCLAAIPYVGTVILLPVIVFAQAYPLCFIEQFGPEWQFFLKEKSPPANESSPFPSA